ncbi:MAG: CPBP family intramembrane metalloprotease [Siphonobacter aquaeclarae]|nr:CPBP family intramembrane metalloprotease [Siphonobacter aquaeclarae]
MIGILILLLISWGALRIATGRGLTVLGLVPDRRLSGEIFGSLAATAVLCLGYHLLKNASETAVVSVNPDFTGMTFLAGLRSVIQSVVTEELVFRGAALYLLTEYAREKKAVAISAIAFGIYHWFSFGLWGQVVPMAYVFLLTGGAGWAFALSFVRTRSLYVPVALHLGWNAVHLLVFGKQGYWLAQPTRSAPVAFAVALFLYQLVLLPLLAYRRWGRR